MGAATIKAHGNVALVALNAEQLELPTGGASGKGGASGTGGDGRGAAIVVRAAATRAPGPHAKTVSFCAFRADSIDAKP